MENNNISIFNQKFDFRTFITIFKKYLWIVLIILIVCLACGFAYYRYSKPRYKAVTTIQIKSENKTNQILGINSNLMEKDLAPVIELIRSNEFLKTVVSSLPLDISYYVKGTFLSTELYGSTPFEISYRVNNSSVFDQIISLEFNDYKCLINYNIGNEKYEYLIQPEEWQSVFGMELFIHFPSKHDLQKELDPKNKTQYYFTLNNTNTILGQISKNLTVQVLNETAGTILISYTDYNARKTAEIVNTISEKFIEFDENKKKESANNIIKYIDQQMENVFSQLNTNERDLQNFKIQNNIIQNKDSYLLNKTNIYSSQMSELETKLLNIDFEIMTLEKIMQKLKANPDVNTYELLAMLSGQKTEVFLTSMLNSIQELINKKEILLFDLTANSHKVKIIDEQIKAKKETIIDFTNSTIERLKAEKIELKKKNNEFEKQVFSESSYDEIEFSRLQRLYSINEDFYSQLIKTKAETMILQAGYVSNNIILDKAITPSIPDFPIFSTIMTFALLIALVVSIILLLIIYLFYNKIISTDDISNLTKLPIIGGIPQSKLDMDISQMIVHLRPKSMISESFRHIRTNLEFYQIKDKARIITLSSTVSGEGKTFVAINLAAIYAMSGKKVLIMDFDLRKPRIDKCFNVENFKGISSIILEKHSFNECIIKSKLEGLDFITSGPLPPNPSEFIMTPKLNNLLKEANNNYDIIIIDTPPIGIVTDALTTYKLADNQIYVLRAGVSPKAFVNNINNFIKSSHLANMNIVLNGIERGARRFGYEYTTGYGNHSKNGYYGGVSMNSIHNSYYDEEPKRKKSVFKFIKKIK